MPDITRYLNELERKLATGVAQEHAHRPALQSLLESVETGLNAVNDPKRIAVGAPDFILMRGQDIPIGFLEAKDLDEDLSRVERGEQMQRYLGALPNLILTNYLEFRWYVEGEQREVVQLGTVKGKSIRRDSEGTEALARLLAAFVAQEPPVTARPRELAERMAAATPPKKHTPIRLAPSYRASIPARNSRRYWRGSSSKKPNMLTSQTSEVRTNTVETSEVSFILLPFKHLNPL